jgi:hypothetical protein
VIAARKGWPAARRFRIAVWLRIAASKRHFLTIAAICTPAGQAEPDLPG